jgi:hypothetical protein
MSSAAPGCGAVVGRAEASLDVVVDHADVLHERVHARWADEAAPLRLQLLGGIARSGDFIIARNSRELYARGDAELREHVAEIAADGVRRDEKASLERTPVAEVLPGLSPVQTTSRFWLARSLIPCLASGWGAYCMPERPG